MSLTRAESTGPTCERCGRPVPKKPQGGRPYRFCPVSADDPDLSCLELDKRERAALDRAGLGELVAAFRTERTALIADLAPLREVAARVQNLEDLVQQIADAAIAQADQAAAAQVRAEAGQRAAERAMREAEQRTTRAYEARDEALAERDLAVADEQRARADAQAAITRATAAEHARGQAEGVAAEQRRVLEDERERRERAESELRLLRADLDTERQDREAVAARLAEAEREQVRQQREHHDQLTAAAAELAGVRAELDRAQVRYATTEARLGVLASEVEDGQRRIETLRDELAAAHTEATHLTSRAELAEQRHRDATAAAEQQQAAADQRYQALLAAIADAGITVTAPDTTVQ